ncbi:YbfB/YjiJ family MFS transporter, partial [Morganella morganii]|uniref:YbfB/YjiJ family MFS transporter n=1 Tax=Morganella morganii TaxID=582 RepID=UPI001D153E2F
MTTSHSARQTTALHIAVSGFLALVVAMGIGRFAFTPQVPLMIDEHQLDLTTAGIVAAWNYLGYLAGSFDAMRAKRGIELRLWTGLWGAVIITLLSAVISGAVLHSIARFFIGWASGWTLVLAAAWTNDALAKLNRPALSVAVYGGTGTGILLCGLAAIGIQGLSLTASQGWWIYGAAALVFSLYVSRYLPRPGELSSSNSPHSKPLMTPKIRRLLWSYALAGFGYILPATFLSQMAAARFPGSLFAQFVWPVFGIAAVAGIVAASAARRSCMHQRRPALTRSAQTASLLSADVMPAATRWDHRAFFVVLGTGAAVLARMPYVRALSLMRAVPTTMAVSIT